VPFIASQWGWKWAFILTGAIGFIWLILWFYFYEIPAKHKKLSAAEYEFIHSDVDEGTQQADNSEKLSWGKLLTFRQTWAFAVGKFLTDPIWWFYLFWLPDFLKKEYLLSETAVALPLALAYTIATVGSIFGGWLPMYFMKNGWNVFRSRKTAMLIYAFCALPVLSAQYFGHLNMWMAVIIVGFAMAAHQAWIANIFTTVSDMFPKKSTASVTGIGGMFGAIGGIIIAKAAGFLFDAYRAGGIAQSWVAAKANGLGDYLNTILATKFYDKHDQLINLNQKDLGSVAKEVVDKLKAIDPIAFDRLKELQTPIVKASLSQSYLIMFCICGSAYLLGWLIMHFLVPKMKSINEK
jgi:ACS family hexuronate transporter-like MFS transporter